MDPLLESVLKNKVEPRKLISWLCTSVQYDPLKEFENYKNDFVPTFMNFLREQTTGFLHSSSHTGLTPNKNTSNLKISKYVSPNIVSKKLPPNKGFSSRAKTLDFSGPLESPIDQNEIRKSGADVSPHNVGSCSLERNSCQNSFVKTPKRNSSHFSALNFSESPISSYHVQGFNTSTPRVDSSKGSCRKSFGEKSPIDHGSTPPVRASERRNVLGDFIITGSYKKQNKRAESRESLKEWNYQMDALLAKEQTDFNIEDKESFPLVGSKPPPNRDNQIKKRINPTRVPSVSPLNLETEKRGSSSFGIPRKQNETNAFLMAPEAKIKSLDQERKLLKEQKEKFKTSFDSPKSFSKHASADTSLSSLPSSKSSPNTTDEDSYYFHVTAREELDYLSQIYSSLILCNMIPNIMVEFYFLLQLLTVGEDKTPMDDSPEKSPFESSYDCMYFSVKTLASLEDCITLFDRSLVKALSENVRISNFNLSFQRRLVSIMEASSVPKRNMSCHPKSPILSVSFQSETDNKNNFPTVVAFQVFRKQRDLFYETLRIWEDSHLIPGWSFIQGLGGKVRQIIFLQQDPTNLVHLARLFLSQLLTMCRGDEQMNMTSDVEGISVLCQLKKQHPEKYKRLNERLVTPAKFGGPVPSPSFPGSQDFFRNFIISGSHAAFNTHLKNVFVRKIIELNCLEHQMVDLEGRENQVEHLFPEIISTLQNLRLIAKFLGFLEFLPYQSTDPLPDVVIGNHLLFRNKVPPPLPLLDMVKEAASSGCLVIVIPWVVEFLSMVDSVALHTRFYLTLMFVLIWIYRALCLFRAGDSEDSACEKCSQSNNLRMINCGNGLFLKLVVGWLLSLPNVPEGLFYVREDEADIDMTEFHSIKQIFTCKYAQLCFNCMTSTQRNDSDLSFGELVSPVKNGLDITPHKGVSLIETPLKPGKRISPLKTPSKFAHVSMLETPDVTPNKLTEGSSADDASALILDTCNLIDYNTLVLCCPFVHELKGVLTDFAMGNVRCSKGGNVRKITPLSAPDKTTGAQEKSVQILLEESFFHNQPSSTKKTVDFVVERIFSNILRNVRTLIIPKFKDGCVSQLRACISSGFLSSPSFDKVVELADKKVNKLSSELSSLVKKETLDQTNEMIQKDCLLLSLQFLLPTDISASSMEICCKIVQRSVLERLNGWVSSHLTPGFCTKELTVEAHKYIKQFQKSQWQESNADVSENSSGAMNLPLLEDQSLELSINLSNSELCVNQEPSTKDCLTQIQCHDEILQAPSSLLLKFKNELKRMMLPSDSVKESGSFDVTERLGILRKTLQMRLDLTPPMFKALETLSVDWIVAVCICHPHLVTKEALQLFTDLWLPDTQGGLFSNISNFSVFLSARTIMLLGQRSEKEQEMAWKKLEEAIEHLVLVSKMMTQSQLQDLCIALTRHIWPQSILNGISTLIRNFVDTAKRKKDFDELDFQFVDWVGWITDQMASMDDYG